MEDEKKDKLEEGRETLQQQQQTCQQMSTE